MRSPSFPVSAAPHAAPGGESTLEIAEVSELTARST
jgi:hypothetical protein